MAKIFSNVLDSKLVEDPIVFLWHLGEPLAAPLNFYKNAFGLVEDLNKKEKREYIHSFQTNAILLNNHWISLIKQHNIRLGVSLDGPSFLHNAQRVDRRNRGTHELVMRGIRMLKDAEVPFSVIMVVTRESLNYADEICDFFLAHQIQDIGFNIDEIEGIHRTTSFSTSEAIDEYKSFFRHLLDRASASSGQLRIREVWTNLRIITGLESEPYNTTNQPFRIFNFESNGNFSTFCPELISAKNGNVGNFVMGNILNGCLDDITNNPVFQRVSAEVREGVNRCKKECDYWAFCGGGSPSNKYFEQGRFDITETTTCRFHKKATVDVILEHMEDSLLGNIEKQNQKGADVNWF